MAHYAFVNDKNIVTQVIVGRDEDDLVEGVTSWEEYYGARHNQVCLRTSYNTRAGEHTGGGTPFRLNYAGVGYTYNEELDGFIPPQAYPSWILDETKGIWNAPVEYPTDGEDYIWNENQKNWELVVTES